MQEPRELLSINWLKEGEVGQKAVAELEVEVTGALAAEAAPTAGVASWAAAGARCGVAV